MIDSAQLIGANGSVCQINTNQIPLRIFEVQTDESTDETQKVRDHGLWDAFDYMGKMVIHVEGDILGQSPSDYWNLRAQLAAPMVPVPELGYKWVTQLYANFSGWPGEPVTTYCSIESRLDAAIDTTRGPSGSQFVFALKARDPRFYSAIPNTFQTGSPQVQGGGFTFPFKFPITFDSSATGGDANLLNNGNANTYPVVTINGPCISPVLTAFIQGVPYRWAMSNFNIPDGSTVTVDMKALTAIYSDGFNSLDVYSKVTAASQWFFLPPGTTEVIFTAISPGPDCNALFTWPNAYVIA